MSFLRNLINRLKYRKRKRQRKSNRRIFIASDLHLGHKNIIRYCHRPFRSVQSMNRRLVGNWNRTIRKNDIVYFLGDLAFGRGSRNTDYWYRKLNGRIYFIKGNHDRSRRIKFHRRRYLKYQGMTFLLVHSPFDVPKDWNGWVIHGHKHNGNKRFPFIDKRNKRINVSCELTHYYPININALIKRIKD